MLLASPTTPWWPGPSTTGPLGGYAAEPRGGPRRGVRLNGTGCAYGVPLKPQVTPTVGGHNSSVRVLKSPPFS
jgi:hypothetical protein